MLLWAFCPNLQLHLLEIPSIIKEHPLFSQNGYQLALIKTWFSHAEATPLLSFKQKLCISPTPSRFEGGSDVFLIPQYNFQTLLAPLLYKNCLKHSLLRFQEYYPSRGNLSLLLFRLLPRTLPSPSVQIWHSLLWSVTLLFLTLYSSLKFLNESHRIDDHLFANESHIFISS